MQKEKVIIIGSGPAGLTAALYTARANLEPLVFVGDLLGGQVALTHEIENYPGFPEGLSGAELVDLMKRQAERFGARLEYSAIVEADLTHGRPFKVKDSNDKEYLADSLIVTSGANPRKLQIPGEAEYTGTGVSYCGTCDGFFFRGKDIVVVGGGDSALEEGLFLTRFANKVDVIHRRDELRAGHILQERAFNNEKINFVWDTVVEEIKANENGSVNSVVLRNVKTGDVRDYPTEGVFIFIGHIPNSNIFEGQLEFDEEGYVITDKQKRTNIEGVFAAGEIQDPVYRQVATSVGQGTAAAMSAERWLAEHEDELEVSTKPIV
jgi:thioredoxin reductase (NADPH)